MSTVSLEGPFDPISARRTVTLADPIAVANAIKTSIATSASPAVYTTFNGALAGGPFALPRTVSFTSTSNAGSYVDQSTVVFTGTDVAGNVLTETLLVTGTGGGQTVVGSKGFLTVTAINVAAQANASGAFTFGVRDVVAAVRRVRVGVAGDLKVGYDGGSTDVIPSCVAGDVIAISPTKIFGDASTTATKITLSF